MDILKKTWFWFLVFIILASGIILFKMIPSPIQVN